MSTRKLASLLLGLLLVAAPALVLRAETATPQSVGLSTRALAARPRARRAHDRGRRDRRGRDARRAQRPSRLSRGARRHGLGVEAADAARFAVPHRVDVEARGRRGDPHAGRGRQGQAQRPRVALHPGVRQSRGRHREAAGARPRRPAGRGARRRPRRPAAGVLQGAGSAGDHRARPADAYVGAHERPDGQLRRECLVQQAARHRSALGRGARRVAARVSARHALVLQRRRRVRRARATSSRSPPGRSFDEFLAAAPVRAARHARRDVLAEHRAALAARERLSAPRRRLAAERQSRLDVGPEVSLRAPAAS